MAYISKIKLQDSVYEIIADKNTDKKLLATQEYVADAVITKEEKIYKQNDEPVDAPDGAIWIDLDAEGSGGGHSVVVDNTLTISGAAADAKAVGDKISVLNTLVGNTSVSEQISTTINARIPQCSIENNGQFLQVVNGVAAWTTIPNAEDGEF